MNGGGRGVPEWSEVVVLEEGRVSGNSRVVWDIGGKDFKGIRMMGEKYWGRHTFGKSRDHKSVWWMCSKP